MSLWEGFDPVPADAVLGVADAAARDPNPDTVDLSVGGYRDAAGRAPLLGSVAEALAELVERGEGRGYGKTLGTEAFQRVAVDLVLPGRPRPGVLAAQAVGGTGALRLLVDMWRAVHTGAAMWVTDPAYPNHVNVAAAAGVVWRLFPHRPTADGVDVAAFDAALAHARRNDLLVLHGCCHNPTGVDPSPAQWETIAQLAAERGLLPVLDLAYLGFGRGGIDDDLAGVRAFADAGQPFAVCVSFSKNLVLAGERVGALVMEAGDAAAVAALRTRLNAVARAMWSSPSRFGAELAVGVLADPGRRARWERDLYAMANRIRDVRRRLHDVLVGATRLDVAGVLRQQGLFWYSGLTVDEVRRLREEHSIYVLDSGRINVGGMSDDVVERVGKAIVAVSG